MNFFKPKVILFRGLPGVGKTYLSDKVAEELRISIIRKDDIYDCLYSALETHQQRNKICYDFIYRFIDTNLKERTDLIIDCPFKNSLWILTSRKIWRRTNFGYPARYRGFNLGSTGLSLMLTL